uniref:FRIGIDA-like protein n=1 Tax=Oryza punctata TaxID=4537 RepID=A0A0E0M6R6_ORYPU
MVEQAEAFGGRARIAELELLLREAWESAQDLRGKLDAWLATSELAAAEKATLTKELGEKEMALCSLKEEIKLRTKNTQDAAKTRCEELVKALEPTLKLLFPSRCDGKDPVQLALELVPEGSAVVRRLSESVANISACHALAVVKTYYPRINLTAVEEGYVADCFEEDMERLLGEVAPPAAAL